MDDDYKQKLWELCEPCLKRPDLGSKIELVSIEWLLEMSNPTPSETTDLGEDRPGVMVDMQELAKDLKKRGLREPLIISVGCATNRARLEAGNHRARVLIEMGFLHAPAICWVGPSHVGFEGNGLHDGRSIRFWPGAKPLVAMGPYGERYFERPSLILPCVGVWPLQEPKSAAKAAAKVSQPKQRKAQTPSAPAAPGAPGAPSQS